MKDLIIFGASGLGRETLDTINRINAVHRQYNILGFIENEDDLIGKKINGISIIGNDAVALKMAQEKQLYGIIAIASHKIKRKIEEKMGRNIVWENIIDPSVIISPHVEIGVGNIIQPYTVVCSNSKIGNHCIINLHGTIGHDAILEDYVSVMPYGDITGYVHLERGVYLGAGTHIIPNIRVREGSVLGAGSVVVKDIEETGTYVGVPVKKIK